MITVEQIKINNKFTYNRETAEAVITSIITITNINKKEVSFTSNNYPNQTFTKTIKELASDLRFYNAQLI